MNKSVVSNYQYSQVRKMSDYRRPYAAFLIDNLDEENMEGMGLFDAFGERAVYDAVLP